MPNLLFLTAPATYIISGGKDCLTYIRYIYELIMSILLVFVPTSFFSLPTPTNAENEKFQYGCIYQDRSDHSVATHDGGECSMS